MAALMQGKGLLVANEIKNKRIGHLIQNVERWGAGNVLITNESPERLADTFGAVFDKVLVDAPCSGEGMFRKDQGARAEWSQEMVEGCAVRQKNILALAVKLVRPGGRLLYSTCTFSAEEDEGVIDAILRDNPDISVVEVNRGHGFDPGEPGWIGADPSLIRAVRLFPHHMDGEGHFACLMQKAGQAPAERNLGRRLGEPTRQQRALWQTFCAENLTVELDPERVTVIGDRLYYLPPELPPMGNLRVGQHGVWLGNIKKDRIEPAHGLALFLPKAAFTRSIDLPHNSEEVKAYLRGEVLAGDGNGWAVVCVDGYPLGWGKLVQGQVKNHYPRGWMQLGG